MNKIKIILVLIAGALLLWWIVFEYNDSSPAVEEVVKEQEQQKDQGYLADTPFSQKQDATAVDITSLAPISQEYASWSEYLAESYKFSFRHPVGSRVTQFDENNGEMILVRDPNGENPFQIFITPYDEPANSLTAARVKQDLPNIVMEQLQEFLIGNGVSGLAFISQSESFGVSREVWFVWNEHLYQISTYIESQGLLQDVLRTWRFEK